MLLSEKSSCYDIYFPEQPKFYVWSTEYQNTLKSSLQGSMQYLYTSKAFTLWPFYKLVSFYHIVGLASRLYDNHWISNKSLIFICFYYEKWKSTQLHIQQLQLLNGHHKYLSLTTVNINQTQFLFHTEKKRTLNKQLEKLTMTVKIEY